MQSIVNADVLLSPLRTKESVLSSKIEGTQATLEDVMRFDAAEKEKSLRYSDIIEIVNYRLALETARQKMHEYPLSLSLLKEIHTILMNEARGKQRSPGEFRSIQNWIGEHGSTIKTARFVPPDVQTMKQSLHNWEKYLHFEEKDALVQLAVIHAQFEIIHPFLDGNGRIGRILIPLFLYHKDIIRQPVFYMSDYLESNRQQYYDSLICEFYVALGCHTSRKAVYGYRVHFTW